MKISIRHRYIAKIPALEVTTEEQKNEALPLIVYYHGWQSAKELSLTQARKLAHEEFRVILPDAMNMVKENQDLFPRFLRLHFGVAFNII